MPDAPAVDAAAPPPTRRRPHPSPPLPGSESQDPVRPASLPAEPTGSGGSIPSTRDAGEFPRVRSRWAPHADHPRPTPFAQWLTGERLARGLRQADLAARLGVQSGRISELESGRRRPRRDFADRIQSALGPETPPYPWPPD